MAARRSRAMKPHFKIWIVFGDRVKFGDGRAHLLELVDRLGSLKQAVDRVGMSYRHGWGYFRELERESGMKLLAPRAGEGPRAGMRLTAAGRRFLGRYRRLQRLLEPAVQRHFGRAFGRR
jgi:molybdate transport system regulatory protein